MAIAEKIKIYMEKSSWIRKMFEEGARLKAQHGADKVFDFSLGNPNLEPPKAVHQALSDLLQQSQPGLHAYMANAGYPETRKAVADYLRQHPVFEKVGFVLFGNQAFQAYARATEQELQAEKKGI